MKNLVQQKENTNRQLNANPIFLESGSSLMEEHVSMEIKANEEPVNMDETKPNEKEIQPVEVEYQQVKNQHKRLKQLKACSGYN